MHLDMYYNRIGRVVYYDSYMALPSFGRVPRYDNAVVFLKVRWKTMI